MTHPSLPRDRRVKADFSESAETAVAVSKLEVKLWCWLHHQSTQLMPDNYNESLNSGIALNVKSTINIFVC